MSAAETLCWKCDCAYEIHHSACPECGAANANVDFEAAQREAGPKHPVTVAHLLDCAAINAALLDALRGLLAMAPAVAPAAGLLVGIEERHAKAIDAARAAIAQAEGKS